jgi:hypothetical protein
MALPGFRKLDDLFGDRLTGRTDGTFGVLKHHNGHFESDSHEASGLVIKPMTFQVGPDGHNGGTLIQFPQI